MQYLCVLIYFVFFAGVAMTVAEGLWNNTLTLIAILICGPLAIAVGYPVGLMLQEKFEKPVEQTWYFVFGGVWLVFFVSIDDRSAAGRSRGLAHADEVRAAAGNGRRAAHGACSSRSCSRAS